MTWLLWSAAALLAAMLTSMILLMLAAVSHVDAGVVAGDIDPDDGDDDRPPSPWIFPAPTFPIHAIGASGQHDRYPIGDGARQYFIDQLDASWNLPAREPGAAR